MKNKRYFILVILILCMTINITWAYFIMDCHKENLISVGNNKIEVIENYHEVKDWVANETYIKQVKINNSGTIPCYVRVLMVASNNDYIASLNLASNYENYWIKEGDYYYYKKVLAPNDTTPNLLESVTMANTSNDHKEPFDIYVYAESVQNEGYLSAIEAFNDIK